MSDIFHAVSERETEGIGLKVEALALDPLKLFPAPSIEQQVELASVASRLLDFKPSDRGSVICVAACSRREGASYVSYNLARTMALILGRRTAWIDANFRNPQPVLQARAELSLVTAMDDPATVDDLAGGDVFVGVAGGRALSTRRADLASERLSAAFEAFSRRFDFIIIDCPPILEAMDTALMGAAADGLVVVVEAKRLKHQVVNHSLDNLRNRRVNVLGTVLNKRRFELPRFIYNRL